MTGTALNNALENIYDSLKNDNLELDKHIAALKKIMQAEDAESVEVKLSRLPQPNRQGRKMMQTYFKKRGVTVTFGVDEL